MALSNEAIYAQGVFNKAAKATAAKTTMDDTTNAVLLYTADDDGALIKRCKAWPQAANGATVCYLFTQTGSGTVYMKAAKQCAAQPSISTTVVATPVDMGPSEDEPLRLSGGEKLYCAISVALAAGFVFELEGENL